MWRSENYTMWVVSHRVDYHHSVQPESQEDDTKHLGSRGRRKIQPQSLGIEPHSSSSIRWLECRHKPLKPLCNLILHDILPRVLPNLGQGQPLNQNQDAA